MFQRTLTDLLFPARDLSFRKLIDSLSVLEVGPPADNLMSNEDSFPRICSDIQQHVSKNGIYLGVGPDQNFSYIAHTQPRLAFILDHRRRNLLLHLVHKALFGLSPDRISYLNRLTARQPKLSSADLTIDQLIARYRAVSFNNDWLSAVIDEVVRVLEPYSIVRHDEWSALATIQAKLAGPGMNARFLALPIYPTLELLIRTQDRLHRPAHFLTQEVLYQRVRELQLRDCILPLTGDFADSVTLPRLARWLRMHQLTLSFLYISDVEFFLLRSGRFDSYVQNLSLLPWSASVQIARTSTREITHPARVAGDHSTTTLEPITSFLERAHRGLIQSADDLFDQ
jgi:hypothetical protein